jgi:hypothetical protein
MGKEGRRFLPNLKKLGSPRLNLDESYMLYNMQRYKFLRKEKIIKENVYECEKI